MNGVNGSHSDKETLQWKIGLVNYQNRYLTAETFGFKINASGLTMRKKQFWVLEHDPQNEEVVYLKSHLGRYLSSDKKGNVRCDSEARGPDEKFTLVYESATSDQGYRWAIRNFTHGYFFGGSEDNLICYEKQPGASEWWVIHLAVHPQVNLKNVNRKRYAHLDLESEELHIDELIPWGSDALITLEFREGKYAVKTCDNRYLHREGGLVSSPGPDTIFTIEIKSGQYAGIALKDCMGRYLTAVGRFGTMKTKNKSKGKDELFTLEDSHPQVIFTASNGKKASILQGVDVMANQGVSELRDTEIFQVEYEKKSKKWFVRTKDNKYWKMANGVGIEATASSTSNDTMFDIEWLDNGSAAIKANNGRYVTSKSNGSLQAVCDSVSDKEKFYITIVNRPILVLRCDYGFVGFKTAGSSRVECNKSVYDIIYTEHSGGQNANYFLKAGADKKYWAVATDGTLNADSNEPQPFQFELFGQSKFYIKAPNGMYIKGENNGIMAANADKSRATLWEY